MKEQNLKCGKDSLLKLIPLRGFFFVKMCFFNFFFDDLDHHRWVVLRHCQGMVPDQGRGSSAAMIEY